MASGDKKINLNKWANYASILGIPITIMITWIVFTLQEEKRVPIILFDKPVEVLDLGKLTNNQFIGIDCIYSVYPVTKNVYLQKFYFWNDGRKTIEASDVLKTISLVPIDTNTAIVDVNLLTQSRKIIGANISVNVGIADTLAIKKKWVPSSSMYDDSSCIPLRFSLLEHHDGFTGQIVYISNKPTDFRVRGIVKETNIRTTLPQGRMMKRILYQVLIVVLIIGITILAVSVLEPVTKGITERLFKFHFLAPKTAGASIFLRVVRAIILVILVIMVLAIFLRDSTRGTKEGVPFSIKQETWQRPSIY